MSENTKIEWATHTFNPWEGCQKVGPGCDHCYAETRNARFAGGVAVNWGPGAPRRRTSSANWAKPLAWNANHAAFFAEHGRRQRVFCASLADVFDNAVDPQWRNDLFELIRSTPNLDWLLLTKRIGNVRALLQDAAERAVGTGALGLWTAQWHFGSKAPENVWLGATIVNQEEADRDISKLLAVPAAKRFLSMEPLLGPVDLGAVWVPNGILRNMVPAIGKLDWVIVGGESGPGARPMRPDWARSLRDQCDEAGVPFLFKQWGEWAPPAEPVKCWNCVDGLDGEPDGFGGAIGGTCVECNGSGLESTVKVGKKAAGRLLDGRTWDEVPS